jgi:hypothetical protein
MSTSWSIALQAALVRRSRYNGTGGRRVLSWFYSNIQSLVLHSWLTTGVRVVEGKPLHLGMLTHCYANLYLATSISGTLVILFYDETILHNNVDHMHCYQDSKGSRKTGQCDKEVCYEGCDVEVSLDNKGDLQLNHTFTLKCLPRKCHAFPPSTAREHGLIQDL